MGQSVRQQIVVFCWDLINSRQAIPNGTLIIPPHVLSEKFMYKTQTAWVAEILEIKLENYLRISVFSEFTDFSGILL